MIRVLVAFLLEYLTRGHSDQMQEEVSEDSFEPLIMLKSHLLTRKCAGEFYFSYGLV